MYAKRSRSRKVAKSRYTRLSRRISRIKDMTYGDVQKQIHVFTQPAHITRGQPLLLNLSNMSMEAVVWTPDTARPGQVMPATHFDKPAVVNAFWAGCQDDILEGKHKALMSTYKLTFRANQQNFTQYIRIDVFTVRKSFPFASDNRNLPMHLNQLADMTHDNTFNGSYFKRYGKPKFIRIPATDDKSTDNPTASTTSGVGVTTPATGIVKEYHKFLKFKHNRVILPGSDLTDPQAAILGQVGGGPAPDSVIESLEDDFGYINNNPKTILWMLISASNDNGDIFKPNVTCQRTVWWRDSHGRAA
jgi:hypothetical protein